MTTLEFDALGTSWWINTEETLDDHTTATIRTQVAQFDQTYSRFRPDSLVSQINRAAGRFQFPDDAAALFGFYRRLYDATAGAVTPLVGRALEHLGYDAEYSLRRRPGPAVVPRWDDVLHVDAATVTTTEPLLLDVGAAGKGRLVDLVADTLHANHVHGFLIDASGDLRHHGDRPCEIALEDPSDSTRAIGTAPLSNSSVAASTPRRRRWGPGLHHIIDPTTAEPTTAVAATWAFADTAMHADGLATALFFTPPDVLARSFDFQWVRILHTGVVEHSEDFAGEIFYEIGMTRTEPPPVLQSGV